jgi:hypothetical protein
MHKTPPLPSRLFLGAFTALVAGCALDLESEPVDDTRGDLVGDYAIRDVQVCTAVAQQPDTSFRCDQPLDIQNLLVGSNPMFLLRLTDVAVDHRYRVEVMRNGELFLEETSSWFSVGASGWRHSGYWYQLWDVPRGSYEVAFEIDTGEGFERVAEIAFDPWFHETAPPYVVDQVALCSAVHPATGACTPLTSPVTSGQRLYILGRITEVYVNHAFSVHVTREGANYFDYTSPEKLVPERWDYSFGHAVLDDVPPGTYAADVVLWSEGSIELLDSLSFTVVEAEGEDD